MQWWLIGNDSSAASPLTDSLHVDEPPIISVAPSLCAHPGRGNLISWYLEGNRGAARGVVVDVLLFAWDARFGGVSG